MRHVSNKLVEKIKTLISYSINFIQNRALHKIMWPSMVVPDMPQMII